MVKIINIDTKARTIRIDNADSDIKTWRTTESGTHFPIKKGESTKEALDKFVEKKRPEAKKESSQPTSYDLDDAFEEAELGAEWSRAKHRMDSHGVDQYTIKDIIDSGMYEAGDIIEALESNSHDKIDEMKKMADRTVGEKRREAQWEKQFGPLDEKKYQEWKAKKLAEKKEAPKPEKKERSWKRGPREDEDAYFERREKTMAEARKLDKVSDWFKKAYAGEPDVPKNKDITFDELADKMLDGTLGEFYEAVGVDESESREKIFEELSERTGRPFDDFYDAWLHGGSKGTPSRVQKQKESVEYMDKLLKVAELDPELKRLIINARDRAKKELKQ